MLPLRRRINVKTFVITLRQLAKHLKADPQQILNWEKWEHVLWVHLEGRGGYFISYRKLQQWLAACRTLRKRLPQLEFPRCNLVSDSARSLSLYRRSDRPTIARG
jgi:lipid-A-disaccharide synthase-like uncharacterized protein